MIEESGAGDVLQVAVPEHLQQGLVGHRYDQVWTAKC